MYAVNTHFQFREPMSENLRDAIVQNIVDPLSKAPGFRGYYAMAPSDRDVVTFMVWDSQADAERYLEQVTPWMQQNVVPHLTNPPQRTGGEVVDSRQK